MASLQATYDSCEVHLRGLEGLGITADKFGIVMAPIILTKLPSDVRLILTRQHGDNIWDLSKLREYLKNEITARERKK